MDIHQCPRCELRFVNTSELRHHFEFDHAADPSVFEPYRYRPRVAEPAHRTILLVGNETLERDAVIEEVARRAGAGTHVLVVVPATHSAHHDGVALARVRMRSAVERLEAAGVVAHGEVGDPDPYTAVCRALGEHAVDEVLLSTLPPSSSRWLSVDLPGRIRRHSSRPVTVLTPAPAAGPTG